MRWTLRNTFAVSLFVAAAIPAGFVLAFEVGSPVAVVDFAATSLDWLGIAMLGALVAFGVAMLWPPFLPTLRLRSRKMWRRLGTDRGPMFEGLAQLRNLETHANRLLVGRLARQLGDLKLALENLERAYAIEPTHISGRYQLALLYEELGRLDDAGRLLAEVIDADESHAFGDAMLHLARVLHRRGHSEECLQVLRRHQRSFPGNRQVHLLAALALARIGDRQNANHELAQARRPPKEGELLPLEESLARAQARVTKLLFGGGQ